MNKMENSVKTQETKIAKTKGDLKVTAKKSAKVDLAIASGEAKAKAKAAPGPIAKAKELTPNQKKTADLKAGKKFKLGAGTYRLVKDEKGEFYVADAVMGSFETLVKKFEGKLFRTSRHLMGRNISVSVMLDEVTIIEENDLVELVKGPKA